MTTNEEIIKILRIERECVSRADECDRQCNNCDLVQDTNKLLNVYGDAIYKLEMLSEFEKEYSSIVSENQDLSEENDKLRKEVKKRRREKRKWKRRALMYENCLETMRDRVRAINNKLSNKLEEGQNNG